MGQSKREFADVRMSIEYYHSLDQEHKDNMELRKIHAEGWDEEYNASAEYMEQKKLTRYKEYQKLEAIKYKIRNK